MAGKPSTQMAGKLGIKRGKIVLANINLRVIIACYGKELHNSVLSEGYSWP